MAVLAGYNGAIVTKQGASAMTFASGASLTVAAGALLTVAGALNITGTQSASGTTLVTSGSLGVGSTGSLVVKPEATTINNPVVMLQMGRNQFWYLASSAACPTFSASPGDLLWAANSASTTLWFNHSDGAAGSNWSAFRGNASNVLPIK